MLTARARLWLAASAVIVACGCYTQLATVDRTPPVPPEQPCPDSLQDSCSEAAAQRVTKDTVVIRDDRRQVCYWSRNWWGEPVLRCYRTYYPDEWVSYYHEPWWYDRYGYGAFVYRSCPPYYYYDPYTGYCRYGRDYRRYYYPYPSQGPSSGTVKRTPPRPTVEPTPAPTVEPAPKSRETTTGGLTPYNPGGSSRNVPNTSVSPSPPVQKPSATGVTPSSAPATTEATVTTSPAPKAAPLRQSVEPSPAPPETAVEPATEGQGGGPSYRPAANKDDRQEERKPKRRENRQ